MNFNRLYSKAVNLTTAGFGSLASMKKLSTFLIIIIFLCGCSSSRRFITRNTESEEQAYTGSSYTQAVQSESTVSEELIQFSLNLDQAEATLLLGVEAREAGNFDEAQAYLDEVAHLLREQEIEEVPDSTLAERYNTILDVLHQEYCLVLPEVTEISVESPAWALLDQMGESVAEASAPACGQWVSAFSELADQFDLEIVVNERVEKSLCFFLNQGRKAVHLWLERSGRYDTMMRSMLKEEGLPTDLVYLSMIESGFNPRAYSYAHAVGLWQFIKGTGRLYGLKVDWWIDERRDPVKSTRAAAKYLKDLYNDLGDWKLAIAAYNCGKGRVERAIREAGTDDFWKLDLPRQTENHVPAFLAAAIISKNPGAFGFQDIVFQEPYEYEEVTLDHCLDMKLAAECAASTVSELKDLNPELNRWCTPVYKGKYHLKIPRGSKAQFLTEYQKIPDSKKVSWHRHKIRNGETLSHIARRYGISQRAIMDANNIQNRHRIRAGKYLLIPTPYGTTHVASKGSSQEEDSPRTRQAPVASAPKDGREYVVKKGDTLWDIASAYGTSVSKLRQWNGLRNNTIRPGDKLIVGPRKDEPLLAKVLLPSVAEASEAGGEKVIHTVRKRDTLWDIARQYRISVSQLRQWNNLGRSSVIHPKDRLIVGFKNLSDVKFDNQEILYTVKKGDTLWDIARAHKVTISQIRQWNNLGRSSKILPGDKFRLYVSS